jgi:hypothetical protein
MKQKGKHLQNVQEKKKKKKKERRNKRGRKRAKLYITSISFQGMFIYFTFSHK